MGWPVMICYLQTKPNKVGLYVSPSRTRQVHPDCEDHLAFAPSTRIDHAWEVVERMAALNAAGKLNSYWYNFMSFNDPCMASLMLEAPDRVPLEICRAALKAVEGT